ncbi:MAG: amidase [Aureliella sp.]
MSPQEAQSQQMNSPALNRRKALSCLASLGIGSAAFQRALAAQAEGRKQVTAEMVASAEWIADIELSDDQRESVARALTRNLRSAARLREVKLDASVGPALVFRPDAFYGESGAAPQEQLTKRETASTQAALKLNRIAPNQWPSGEEDLAFSNIATQASMLAAGEISSRHLTELYLARLQQADPTLELVVTMLEQDALKQADASDARRRRGVDRGSLDGIPWLAKDLIAVPPHKTTWGAEPFKDQVREDTATVYRRLEASGAVLLAKVSLGALAWGDEWFGGKTRNPWNPAQGSSGSSAGSAAGVAAGLATFAIGSETLGSIVSPTRRCRTSGLRGTFGRVSRHGCMPLSWSMDKIGPIARHVDDLAAVFAQIQGTDGLDPTLVNRPFDWPIRKRIDQLRIGITSDRCTQVEEQAVEELKKAGATIVELDLSSDIPVDAMSFILGVEATSVFEDDFRSAPDADYGLWNDTFRETMFFSAVQYVRANRLRGQLITQTQAELAKVDCVVGANDLLLTNLTGHPSLVVACGSDEITIGSRAQAAAATEEEAGDKSAEKPMEAEPTKVAVPGVVKLTAAAYQESTLLSIGAWLQQTLPPQPSKPAAF